MLKKVIKYENFDGEEREGTYYFNLSQPELVEMELGKTGGLSEFIKKVVAEKDLNAIVLLMKDLILKSYGVKSADGNRFEKSAELSTAFSQTGAYEVLYMELSNNAEAAAAFVNGIIPKKMQAPPSN